MISLRVLRAMCAFCETKEAAKNTKRVPLSVVRVEFKAREVLATATDGASLAHHRVKLKEPFKGRPFAISIPPATIQKVEGDLMRLTREKQTGWHLNGLQFNPVLTGFPDKWQTSVLPREHALREGFEGSLDPEFLERLILLGTKSGACTVRFYNYRNHPEDPHPTVFATYQRRDLSVSTDPQCDLVAFLMPQKINLKIQDFAWALR